MSHSGSDQDSFDDTTKIGPRTCLFGKSIFELDLYVQNGVSDLIGGIETAVSTHVIV